MNTSSAGKPAARLRKLREDFTRNLPERVGQLRMLLDSAERVEGCAATSSHREALQRQFHNLKGSAAVFGFTQVQALAAEAEALAEHCGGDAQCGATLRQLVERLAATVETLVAGEASGDEGLAFGFSPVDLASPPAINTAGRLVYVCDDDPSALEQLVTQLECFGYEVHGFQALDAFERAIEGRRPDCVVMDIRFPENRDAGTETMAAINRQLDPPLSAIFVSARDDFEARLQAVRAGGAAYFHKPAHSIDLVAALDEVTGMQAAEPYRVLVVDDEPEAAEYHCMVLEEAGMLTTRVSDPHMALAAVGDFLPDMVLMDMYMPGCSGIELARVIRQVPQHFSLPIIYFSVESDQRKQRAAMRIGADGFMVKPIDPIALVSEVAIRAERGRALRTLIVRDSLTGLFNHSSTLGMLESLIASSERSNTPLCFALIDLDKFKGVNDQYGHRTGDQVLATLSRMLKQHFRSSDVIGRHGGEEFAVIMPQISIETAIVRINQLRTVFERVEFTDGRHAFACTFSAGVAQHGTGSSLASLFGAADKALYRAKQSGRNRVIAAEQTD
jgi:diguanylate cyclase (GGDEF)-like protein